MIDLSTAPLGILLLRLALAGQFFAHAGLKLFVFKPAGTVAISSLWVCRAGLRM